MNGFPKNSSQGESFLEKTKKYGKDVFPYYLRIMSYLLIVYFLFAQYISLLKIEAMIRGRLDKCESSSEAMKVGR
jgi:hypothetical protein